MVSKSSIFKYKTIKGPLHKVPAVIKLILLLMLSVFCITLPSLWLCAGILFSILISFLCRITLNEQLTDLKPVIFYAILMYLISLLSNIFETPPCAVTGRSALIFMIMPRAEYLQITLRLVLIVQLSALIFRTTGSLEIKEAVRLDFITLFLMFIPEIFNTWSSINLAWKARCGAKGFVKIKTLLFVLISISFEKAAIRAKALEARSKLYSEYKYDVQ